ncbi:RNAase [Reichenbachiella sp. 5M10]|uniref:phospholipid scramblase-related protein n=1 Tax=Reichenbachiella sp. 5M10 TaxID=1889772 RepID=UPI000C152FEE|nr:phospholipid scramblase-related protein [Reichenbachiella sp. 5M10]PIB36472.1 RNAase [Reichenbachiella sp. 5M10]
MNPILDRNLFFVKEHVGMFKAANNYDIHDPSNQEMIMTCREENLGFLTKMFRFTDYKRMTPFDIEIKTATGEKVLTVKRGISIFLSTVEVFDEKDQLVGKFKQKFFSIGGKFDVLDASDRVLCTLKGKWTSWDFKFIKDQVEFASVSKEWAGMGRELFTTADNYMLKIDEKVNEGHPMRLLILAAVMCIDMVLKE